MSFVLYTPKLLNTVTFSDPSLRQLMMYHRRYRRNVTKEDGWDIGSQCVKKGLGTLEYDSSSLKKEKV